MLEKQLKLLSYKQKETIKQLYKEEGFQDTYDQEPVGPQPAPEYSQINDMQM